MTYTYDDFVNAAKNAGLYDTFSQEDLTTAQASPEFGMSMLKLQQDAGKATTEEQKLLVQEAVNQLRSTYGTAPAPAAGSFSYDRESDYKKLLSGATGSGGFQFDRNEDPTYGAVKGDWLSDGARLEDRLLTDPIHGGEQSSWMGAVGQQATGYHKAKLNDQIPTIYQNAWEEYLQEQNRQLDKLGAVSDDRAFDYAVDLQQKQLEQDAAQQKFANDMTLNRLFGTGVPALPDLSGATGSGESGFSYGKDNEHQAALDAVINQEDFAYDRAEDPLYGSLRKTYLREGDRKARDTLAELNAATGGLTNSYSLRRALDAGNAYVEELGGALPELRDNAYLEYLGEFDKKLQALGLLEQDRAFDYAGWLDDYQMEQAARQQEFDNALAMYKTLGYLTPEIAAALGVPYTAPASSGGSSSGGSGGKGDTLDPETAYALRYAAETAKKAASKAAAVTGKGPLTGKGALG